MKRVYLLAKIRDGILVEYSDKVYESFDFAQQMKQQLNDYSSEFFEDNGGQWTIIPLAVDPFKTANDLRKEY